MMKRKFISCGSKVALFATLYLFCFSSSYAGGEECIKLLKEAYAKLSGLSKMHGNIQVEYGIKVTSGKKEASEDRIMMSSNSVKSYISSNQVIIYQDEDLMVAILKNAKTIFICNNTDKRTRELFANSVSVFRDSLIQNISIEGCSSVVIDKKPFQRLNAIPVKSFTNASGIENMEFLIDSASSLITEIKLKYIQNSPIQEIEVVFYSLDEKFSGEIFKNKAVDQVMNNNKLKAEFQDFSLMDMRANN